MTRLVLLVLGVCLAVLLSSCGGGGGGGTPSPNVMVGTYSWIDNAPYNKGSLTASGYYNANRKFDINGTKMCPVDDKYHKCWGELDDSSEHSWYLTFDGIGTIYGHGDLRKDRANWDIAENGNKKLEYDYGFRPNAAPEVTREIFMMSHDGGLKA